MFVHPFFCDSLGDFFIECDNNYIQTVVFWLGLLTQWFSVSLQGPPGSPGLQGAAGNPGNPGESGSPVSVLTAMPSLWDLKWVFFQTLNGSDFLFLGFCRSKGRQGRESE